MEKYEPMKDIGSRNFGVVRLMRNKELVAMKYIERGRKSSRDMEKYELMKDIGSRNFGVVRLTRNKELIGMKYIERGQKIDENLAREIINHKSLRHPNIILFKEVVWTPTYLAIVMEYAAGGELFEQICSAGRFSEDEV